MYFKISLWLKSSDINTNYSCGGLAIEKNMMGILKMRLNNWAILCSHSQLIVKMVDIYIFF